MPEVVRVEREGSRVVVTIDHPPANAISRAVILGVRRALTEAAADPGVRVAILTGSGGRFFAAGADVSEFGTTDPGDVADGQLLTEEIESLDIPTLAAVNGFALGGGCELAMACDLRIASTGARFGQPEVNLGIIPGWGGTQRLPRLVGRARAVPMLLLGDPVDAETALDWGLVSEVVEPDRLLDRARRLADRLAAQAPLAVRAIRRALVDGLDRPLAEGLAAERREFVAVLETEDGREGVSAFLEKRRPTFGGR